MTTKDLEQAILDIILQTYNACYNRKLKVKELKRFDGSHLGYELIFDLDNYEKPIRLAIDGDECQFLDYIKKHFYNHRLDYVDYFEGYKYSDYEGPR